MRVAGTADHLAANSFSVSVSIRCEMPSILRRNSLKRFLPSPSSPHPGVGYSPDNDFKNSPDGISFSGSLVSRQDDQQAPHTTFLTSVCLKQCSTGFSE